MYSLKILLVDDHPVYRHGLSRILESVPGTASCDEASNGQEAIDKCALKTYDVIIMDIGMPVMDGIEASRLLKHIYPDIRIIIMSMYYAKHQVIELLEMNISAYLTKGLDKTEITKAIEHVSRGDQYFPEEVENIYLDYLADKKNKTSSYHYHLFSKREIEIIRFLCKGFTAKCIGEFLGISEFTVNNHRSHIMKKIGVDTVVNVVNYAYRHGIAVP
jgi:DNA-binding NarL/FixJ family response regulator